MAKIKLECMHCFGVYDYHESSAKTPELYCSQECEQEEEEHLAEGNAIVKKAIMYDPCALAHSLAAIDAIELPKTPDSEMKKITDIVDGVFARFERKEKA